MLLDRPEKETAAQTRGTQTAVTSLMAGHLGFCDVEGQKKEEEATLGDEEVQLRDEKQEETCSFCGVEDGNMLQRNWTLALARLNFIRASRSVPGSHWAPAQLLHRRRDGFAVTCRLL